MKKTTILALSIIFVSMIAVSGAANAAEFSVGELPDDMVPGKTYTVPVTVSGDISKFILGIKYDKAATTVEFENYGDMTTGGSVGKKTLILSDDVSSITFDILITPKSSDTITLKMSVDQNNLDNPDYTTTLKTDVRAAQPTPKATQAVKPTPKATQTVKPTPAVTQNDPAKVSPNAQPTAETAVPPVTSLTLSTESPSPTPTAAAPSGDKTIPAAGLVSVLGGLCAAGLLARRKI